MREFFILFSLSAFLLIPSEASTRRDQRIGQLTQWKNIDAKTILTLAEELIQQGQYLEAASYLQNLITYVSENVNVDEVLLKIASCQMSANRPDQCLKTLQRFGRDYVDSSLMPQMVELAYAMGQRFCLNQEEGYRGSDAESKALLAFAFVREHDPYSTQAAEGSISSAHLLMKSSRYDEAIPLLKEVTQTHPLTHLAGESEVLLAECHMGLNKGAHYSRELLEEGAMRLLNSYIKRYPTETLIPRAKMLLAECQRRVTRGELDTIRFYCSQRKWKAAQNTLEQLQSNAQGNFYTNEINALQAFLKDKPS